MPAWTSTHSGSATEICLYDHQFATELPAPGGSWLWTSGSGTFLLERGHWEPRGAGPCAECSAMMLGKILPSSRPPYWADREASVQACEGAHLVQRGTQITSCSSLPYKVHPGTSLESVPRIGQKLCQNFWACFKIPRVENCCWNKCHCRPEQEGTGFP